jgi:hypothetical protein
VKKKDTITAPFVDCWWKKSAATKTTGTYFLKLVTMAKSAHKVAVPGHGNTRNACCVLIGIFARRTLVLDDQVNYFISNRTWLTDEEKTMAED